MGISEILLRSAGATEQFYDTGDYIFHQNSVPQFYYQIAEGEVKLNRYAEDGKEFVQDIIGSRSCIGESMLILEKPYPVNAVAISKCIILKVERQKFLNLLKENPAVFKNMYAALADTTFEKLTMTHTISSNMRKES